MAWLARERRPLRTLFIVGRLVRQWEERLTPRGRYLVAATVLLGLMGADTRRTQVYVLFCIGAGLLAAAMTPALFLRPRARLECALPARATALAPLDVHARIFGADGGPRDLRVQFLRPIRWGSSVAWSRPEVVVSVGRDAPAEVRSELTVRRRGRYELRGPTLHWTDPLHLAAGPPVKAPAQTLLVYPRFWSMASFEIPLGRRYQPGGIPLTSSAGDAIEFVGTRDYREGDPVKNIHWRSWARRGEPVVKEYQEEYFCRIALVLDTFLPPRPRAADHASFEAGISVVASIADYFSRSEYVVDILAAGPDVYEVSAGRSLAYLENILDVLACLEPCPDPAFARITPHLFEKLAQITTVVAVLQDWDEPRERFLREVKALGTAVRAIVVHEGPTTRPWQAVGDEIGQLSQMEVADVERALAGVERAGPPG
jgi:uncharacterized protein (DUF58 family)